MARVRSRLFAEAAGVRVPHGDARMRRFATACSSAVVVALLGCGGATPSPGPAPHGEPVELAQSLEPGAVYEGRLVLTQVLPTGQRVVTTMDVRTEVIDANAGTFTVEDRYDAVEMTMDGQPLDLPPGMRDLGDVRIRYRMDRRGRLADEPTARGATNRNNAPFVERLVKSVGEGSVPFPDRPVAPGGSWSGRRTIDMPVAAGGSIRGTITEKHILVRVDRVEGRRWAVIAVEGDVVLEPLEAEGVSISGSGEVGGERRVLLADGFTSEGKSEVTLRLEGEAGSPPEEFEVTQKTGTRLRIARADASDGPVEQSPPAEGDEQ